jgi:AcrR family transcriptional regulator
MSEINVKDIIIKSATKHFSKYGFYKTTMDEIAKHIHKTKGVLYYYFKSKEELFNEVLKQELSHVKTELSKIIASDKDSLTTIKNYFLTRLKLLSTAVNYHETLKADFFEKYHFVKDVRKDFSDFEYKQIKLILEKGKSEGYFDIKNINATTNAFIMLLNSIELPLYLHDKYSEYESTIDEIVTLVINSLRFHKN